MRRVSSRMSDIPRTPSVLFDSTPSSTPPSPPPILPPPPLPPRAEAPPFFYRVPPPPPPLLYDDSQTLPPEVPSIAPSYLYSSVPSTPRHSETPRPKPSDKILYPSIPNASRAQRHRHLRLREYHLDLPRFRRIRGQPQLDPFRRSLFLFDSSLLPCRAFLGAHACNLIADFIAEA